MNASSVASWGVSADAGELWSLIASAEWLAAVGIPLFVALAAIFAAYLLVRKQLRHDRVLASEERRRIFAHQFAVDAMRAAAELAALSESFARAEDPFDMREFRTQATEILESAYIAAKVLEASIGQGPASGAALSIPEFFGARLVLAGDNDPLWRPPIDGHPGRWRYARQGYAQFTTDGAARHLRTLAIGLEGWSGGADQPTEVLDPFDRPEPQPRPGDFAAVAWWEKRKEETLRCIEGLRRVPVELLVDPAIARVARDSEGCIPWWIAAHDIGAVISRQAVTEPPANPEST